MNGVLTFLGTGTSQGIPIITCNCKVCSSHDVKDKRLRSSVLIQYEHLTLCIDTGPDFRFQMLREKVQNLDAVLYTHEHRDHTAGLDDVRAFNYTHNLEMPLYAPREVVLALKDGFKYIFESDYPGIPKVKLIEIDESPFYISDVFIEPIIVWHHELRVFGYRFGDLAYITDAKTVPDESKNKLKGLKTLIINCLHETRHVSHFNLEEALDFIQEIQPESAYLTHISHQFGTHKEILSKLPPNVFPAHDGLTLNFHLEHIARG